MKSLPRPRALGLATCLMLAAAPSPAQPVRGYATTVHPLATRAALDAFRSGGNAIDAAVAAGLTLGVVDGHNSGIGGGCFFLVRLADGRTFCLDGRETAPATASRDMYLREGQPDGSLSKTGALASGVPGALAVYDEAVRRFGRKTLAEALSAGIRHAEKGFAIDEVFARKLETTATELALFPASRAIFLKPDGQPHRKGDTLRQPDLAASYRAIAEKGAVWFYQEGYPQQVEAWMKTHGGILTAADFHSYKVAHREPLRTRYRQWTILGVPPPSSGGVHIAQMLHILESFPPEDLAPDSIGFPHRVAETMKLAFADRAHWLGDPAFTAVPKGLAAPAYGRELAARIDPTRATPVPRHGDPPDWQNDHFHKHTTHFSTADEFGNWVSCTATINTAFGSKVVVPGTGILLNNEMDDFSIAPGVPNAFRLIGGEANAVAPGKRPLSSMSPTLVLRDDKPILSIGAAGGPTIISQVLLGLIHSLDHGMPPAKALARPRIHHQWAPDVLRIERGFAPDTRRQLAAMGHTLEEVERFGACQIIAIDAQGRFRGASDPRVPGLAAATNETKNRKGKP